MNVELIRNMMGSDIEEAAYPNSLIPKLDNGDLAADPGTDVQSERIGFWRRQFKSDFTRGQKKFDWIFGVVLAILGKFAPFAYVLSFTAIMANMAWLLWGERLKWLNAPLSGLFAIGSLAAFTIGIVLFPFSVLGLFFMFIGALGFTPLFTSFVLLRNSIRTFRTAKLSLEKNILVNSFALAAMASAVIPYLIHLYFRH
jgi:hypothetical protein